MCGLYGILQPGATAATLRAFGLAGNLAQAHRGPDQAGLESGDGWLLAHRRLSIYDLSDKGRQPLHYGTLRIIFNGAIYNFPELRKELESLGHTFRTDTDTEVILAAYREWADRCFERFNGMWALAIIDAAQQTLLLARDRIGIKPLYLFQQQGLLAFASETRALRTTVGKGDALHLEVAGDFLRNGWQDHRPESIWAGIRQFPAGHYAVCPLQQPDQLKFTRYYQLPTEKSVRNESELLEELRELLADSVRLRARSDVGCGLTLSGGIDSSSIAGLLGPGHRTYSALFPDTPYDESPFVAAVLRHTGQENHPFYPGWTDFVSDYRSTAAGQDQPLASAAVVLHYGLMRLVQSTGEKVILNGQGADEIGAGYDKFYPPYLRERYREGWLKGLRASSQVLRHLRLAPDKLAGRLQRRFGRPLPDPFLAPALRAPSAFRQPAATEIRTTSINLLTGNGLPALLRHEDRSAMAFGIESRPPFLDYRVVDFLLKAPADFNLKNGIRKWGIRESVRSLLPDEVYHRKRKLGFATPQHRWLEEHPDFFLGPLKHYAAGPEALITRQAVTFAEQVLQRRQHRHYAQVWRWWAWAIFRETP